MSILMVTNIFSANPFSGESWKLLQDKLHVNAGASLFIDGTREYDALGKGSLCFNVNRTFK